MNDSEPSTEIINTDSKLEPGFHLFICYICDLLPPPNPRPRQCADCHSIYCDECTKIQPQWQCPKPTCGSLNPCEQIYRSVYEFMQQIEINCPGCAETLKYEAAFKHVQDCDKVNKSFKKSPEDMKKQIEEVKK